MVHGPWLLAHASRLIAHGQEKLALGPQRQFLLAMSREPWTLNQKPWGMGLEPWAIDNRFIRKLHNCINATFSNFKKFKFQSSIFRNSPNAKFQHVCNACYCFSKMSVFSDVGFPDMVFFWKWYGICSWIILSNLVGPKSGILGLGVMDISPKNKMQND